MKRSTRIALCKLIRGDARAALGRADARINPLASRDEVAASTAEYQRLRKMHSQFASMTHLDEAA